MVRGGVDGLNVTLALLIAGCGGGGNEGIDSGSGADALQVDAPQVADALVPDALVPDAMPPDAGPPPRWIAYLADQQTDGRIELFIADLDGNYPSMRVNPDLEGSLSTMAGTWMWTKDGGHILYHARHTGDADPQLYRVAIDANGPGTPQRVNAPLTEVSHFVLGNGGLDKGFRESPDGKHIVYLGNHLTGSTTQMYVVDSDLLGVAQRVSSPLAAGESVYNQDWMPWSPDSSKLLYLGAQVAGRYELWMSDVTGPVPQTALRVNEAISGARDVRPSWHGVGYWSSDSGWILYLGDLTADEVEELWVTRIIDDTPGATFKVNGTLVGGGDVFIGYDATYWSPDGMRILYMADQEVNDRMELYVVDMSGAIPGPANKVNGAVGTAGVKVNSFLGGHWYGWSPDSRMVSYLASPNDATIDELFVVDVSGVTPGVAQPIGGPFTATDSGVFTNYVWSPDGSRLVYASADSANADVTGVFVVDVSTGTPGTPARLCPADMNAGFYRWSPDGSRIAFVGRVGGTGSYELYVVELSDLGNPVLMSGTMVANGNVNWSFRWTPDSQQLVFHADREIVNTERLWVVDVAGALAGMPRELSTPMVANGDVVVDHYEVPQ